ncbi:MAG: biotin/lipoyl-containing protein, partial [Myxococcales bacterium]
MVDRYAVTVDGAGTPLAVELEEIAQGQGQAAAGKLRVRVDGRERTVDVRALGGGMWSVTDGVQARLLQVDRLGTKLTVEVSHPDGEPRLCTAEVSDGRARGKVGVDVGVGVGSAATGTAAGVAGRPLTVRAPIPGRLVKLLVKVGDAVKVGQTLLVLEAMKMENELRAPRGGTISALHAAESVA